MSNRYDMKTYYIHELKHFEKIIVWDKNMSIYNYLFRKSA